MSQGWLVLVAALGTVSFFGVALAFAWWGAHGGGVARDGRGRGA